MDEVQFKHIIFDRRLFGYRIILTPWLIDMSDGCQGRTRFFPWTVLYIKYKNRRGNK